MRVLFTTRGSAGHIGPLVPLARACERAGHEVKIAAQERQAVSVERTGLAYAPVGDPPDHEWMPLMAQLAQADFATANELMVGEFFARLDTRAALPGLLSVVKSWQPDILVRETCEFASTVVAELQGVPLARVGIGLASMEEASAGLAAPRVNDFRLELGLPADPDGARLREAPYFTAVPEPLEDPSASQQPVTRRFRPDVARVTEPLPDWWPGNDDPLVYLTFGSVTAGAHLPFFPHLYKACIEALAPLPLRVLVTLGEQRDLGELGELPRNVHVETWVNQDAVASQAVAMVCHGGFGSTLGALAHALPLVVLPLFSIDQVANADAVARAGAGLALKGDQQSQRGLDLPAPHLLEELAGAVERVVGDVAYAREAGQIAQAMEALPGIDAAVEELAAIAGARG